MSDKRAAGTVNFQRRTWDKAEYEKRAKERLEGLEVEDAAGAQKSKEVVRSSAMFAAAQAGMRGPENSERAFLQARTMDLNLEAKLNKRRLVTDSTPQSQVGGYYCDVCECTLRDSATYLNHINGKNHQQKLGFSMRVERVGIDGVKAKLAALKNQSAGAARPDKPLVEMDADDKHAMRAMNTGSSSSSSRRREEDGNYDSGRGRRDRSRSRSRERAEQREPASAAAVSEAGGAGEGEAEDEAAQMAAMMGFSSFASGNSNKRK